jgi:hypothetical protein
MEPPREHIPIKYEYESTREFRKLMKRTVLLRHLRNPIRIMMLLLWLWLITLGIISVVRGAYVLGWFLIAFGLFALYQSIVPFYRFSQNLDSAPPETRYGIGIGETGLAFRGPDTSSNTLYRVMQRAHTKGGLLRIEYDEGYSSYFPAGLLSDAVVDAINDSIAKAKAGPKAP